MPIDVFFFTFCHRHLSIVTAYIVGLHVVIPRIPATSFVGGIGIKREKEMNVGYFIHKI